MPPLENHYSYGCFYCKCSDDAEWQPMGSADSFFTVKKEKSKDKLDHYIEYLKTLRSIKGYLLVDDVLDIFDMIDAELTSEGKKVNPYELYCGNLDEYVRDMKFHRSVCLDEIKVSENVEEIHKLVDDINNVDEALAKLELDRSE